MCSRRRDAGSLLRRTSSACPSHGTARADSSALPLQRLRRLRPVRMFGSCVDLELRDLLPSEPILREHALHGGTQNLFGPAVELLSQSSAAETSGIPGVPVVALLVELVAGHVDLLGVHDDHEVAGVHVRGVLGLTLAAQLVRDAGREPAERLPVGVHPVPVARDLSRFGVISLHWLEIPCLGSAWLGRTKKRTLASAGAKL